MGCMGVVATVSAEEVRDNPFIVLDSAPGVKGALIEMQIPAG